MTESHKRPNRHPNYKTAYRVKNRADYLNLSGTQRYLQLTAELFPELSHRLDAAYGHLIPRRTQP